MTFIQRDLLVRLLTNRSQLKPAVDPATAVRERVGQLEGLLDAVLDITPTAQSAFLGRIGEELAWHRALLAELESEPAVLASAA